MVQQPRFDITAAQIDLVVSEFYSEIRDHPVLGPVFINRLGDTADIWLPHEAKIAGFWRNAILFERGYDGNPMAVHAEIPQVQPEHFPIWLDLFARTLHRLLPQPTAHSFESLARRIGAGLRMGLQHSRAKPGAVPILN